MFILRGYNENLNTGVLPAVRIYGIFDSIDQCIERMAEITSKPVHDPTTHLPNVRRSGTYLFWYREFDDLTTMNMLANNNTPNEQNDFNCS